MSCVGRAISSPSQPRHAVVAPPIPHAAAQKWPFRLHHTDDVPVLLRTVLLGPVVPCLLALALAGGLSACSSATDGSSPHGSASASALNEVAGDDAPPVDPAFAAHFADPIYLGEAEESAPFGNDAGWDL